MCRYSSLSDKPFDNIGNGKKEFYLKPGEYSFVLSGNDEFAPITKNVTIVVGDNGTVDFGTITVQLDDQLIKTMNYSDREAKKEYSDREAKKNYNESYGPDIYLGNETDPYNEYAIRLN